VGPRTGLDAARSQQFIGTAKRRCFERFRQCRVEFYSRNMISTRNEIIESE